MSVYVRVHMCVHVHVCAYVCIFMCVCPHMYINVCIYTCADVYVTSMCMYVWPVKFTAILILYLTNHSQITMSCSIYTAEKYCSDATNLIRRITL